MPRAESVVSVVAVLVACTFGYKLVESSRRSPDATPSSAADVARLERDVQSVAASQADLRAEVAALTGVLRAGAQREEATAAQAPAAPAASPPPAAAPVPPQRSPEAVAAEDWARAVLDQATVAGKWTSADRDQMRAALAGADDDGRREMMRELAQAMNSKRIAPGDLRGPPL